MQYFQQINLNGKELTIKKTYKLPNAFKAYDFFRQISGMKTVAEYEGDINLQLKLLQANNPNSEPVLIMLRELYELIEPTLLEMENNDTHLYLSDN